MYLNMFLCGEEMTNQIGYWVDMDDPYLTYHNDYIESVWWALKQMWDKGTFYMKVTRLCHIAQDVELLFLHMKLLKDIKMLVI